MVCCSISFSYSFVGALGIGPKYLVDEYAILDSRYWVEKDNTVMWVSYMELFTMAPLSYLWYDNNHTIIIINVT